MKNRNNQLEDMLNNYYNRKMPLAFEVDLEVPKMKRIVKISKVMAVACAVAVFAAVGVMSLDKTKTSPAAVQHDSHKPTGCTIRLADEQGRALGEKPVSGNVRKDIGIDTGEDGVYNIGKELVSYEYTDDGRFIDEGLEGYKGKRVSVEQAALSFDMITFDVSGENVEDYDISCKNGTLSAVIPDLKEQKLSGDESISVDDYFRTGKNLSGIKQGKADGQYTCVMWNPSDDALNKDIQKSTGIDITGEMSIAQIKKSAAYKNDSLQTSEDFTKYFGDTVTLNIRYKDGTTESADIAVKIDYKKADKNNGSGYYTVEYK